MGEEEPAVKKIPNRNNTNMPVGLITSKVFNLGLAPEDTEESSLQKEGRRRANEEVKVTVRILKSYSKSGQKVQEEVIDSCCQNLSRLQLVAESAACNSTVVDLSSVMSQEDPCKELTTNTSPRNDGSSPTCQVSSPNRVVLDETGRKPRRKMKKLFRFSRITGKSGSKRKRTSTKGVRFEILREVGLEGEVGNAVGCQEKSKRKRKAAKRIAKTVSTMLLQL